jgi:hypothetical protein
LKKENTMNHVPTDVPVACTPSTVPANEKNRWFAVGKQIYSAVEELRELPDGYACRLPGDEATIIRAAEYIALDRLCCRFATWELRVEPNAGAIWLKITGPAGTKEQTRSFFETTDLVKETVLTAAGLRVLERRPPELAAGM